MLELKDKVQKLEFAGTTAGGEHLAPTSGIEEDVASALINLGYKEAVVKKALAELRISPEDSMEQVLKQALKALMK